MDAFKRPTRMILHGRPHDRNEGTMESRENMMHECAQTNLGSQLSIFYTDSFTQTRHRSNELTRTPSNDPPE